MIASSRTQPERRSRSATKNQADRRSRMNPALPVDDIPAALRSGYQLREIECGRAGVFSPALLGCNDACKATACWSILRDRELNVDLLAGANGDFLLSIGVDLAVGGEEAEGAKLSYVPSELRLF